MKSTLHPRHQPAAWLLLGLILAAGSTSAQIAPVTVRIRSVRVIPSADGPAIEIITTRPIAPKIITLREPPRLVIDLPQTYLSTRKSIDFRSDQIDGIRANQFQNSPPITRIVVDLAKPIGYSWDAAGNRLMIRLRPLEEKVAPAPLVSTQTATSLAPVGPGSSGTIVQAAKREGGGSSLTAGSDTAIMHLPRGGEVRVCPGTTVSVNYSQNGRDMLLAMNTGALEAHYSLDTSADAVMTPDFRIQFVGPGEFDVAISADSHGNTCVRSLPGNTGSAIVSELMGDGAFPVKRGEEVVFRNGQIGQRSSSVPLGCGCPAPAIPTLVASAAPLSPSSTSTVSNLASNDPSAALPASNPNQVHVQVDAPFVFRATDPVVPPPPAREVGRLSLVFSQRPAPLEVLVLPPSPPVIAAKAHNPGFFGKVKGFFAAIFR